MTKLAFCSQCGVRRPYIGMIEVSVVPPDNEDDELMDFCDWKCLAVYATDVITP